MLKGRSKLDLNRTGFDVGLEGKLVGTDIESDKVQFGVGLSLDTGLKIGEDGVKAEILGFGFSFGDDGFGIKLPFFNFKLKK